MSRAFLVIALFGLMIPVALFAFGIVHEACERLCVSHARRFCKRRGLEIRRVRWQPELEPSGVKTEFTLVQLDCLDATQQRRLVALSVWPGGVRKMVREEAYAEAEDLEWPPEVA